MLFLLEFDKALRDKFRARRLRLREKQYNINSSTKELFEEDL